MIAENLLADKKQDHISFWDTLPRPVIGLAPMDGVSDHPFRHIQKKYGNPMVILTEFTSVEGVCLGNINTLRDFLYDEIQRPIVAQIYGYVPDYFRQVAILLCQLGFDGIDINMGCPAKNVANSGAGAGLIRTPKLAQEIIRATQQGVTQWMNGASVHDCPNMTNEIIEEVERRHNELPAAFQQRRLVPVSVKTRSGYDKPVIDEWIPTLLETEPAVICIHGRTLEQKYSGLAHWEEIGRAVRLAEDSETLLFGNGDVKSRGEAIRRAREFGVDGVLIARAAMGNPYVFHLDQNRLTDFGEHANPILARKLCDIAMEHAQLYEETFCGHPRYRFLPMRKHLGWYATGIPGAKRLRGKLVHTFSADDAAKILSTLNLEAVNEKLV